jgi:hypothetical protein
MKAHGAHGASTEGPGGRSSGHDEPDMVILQILDDFAHAAQRFEERHKHKIAVVIFDNIMCSNPASRSTRGKAFSQARIVHTPFVYRPFNLRQIKSFQVGTSKYICK